MPKLLTKSKYMNGLQCQKLLWLVFNDPGKIPAPDAARRFSIRVTWWVNWLTNYFPTESISPRIISEATWPALNNIWP